MTQTSLAPVRVGIIGCGIISHAYFTHSKSFPILKIVACADLDFARAQSVAEKEGVMACTVDQLLADPEIDMVLNLTIPQAHVAVNLSAIKAGKHVYCEKPFSLNVAEGLEVMAEARKRGVLVGCAPDTVLGGGIQTCRKLIDDGAIGKPVAAMANMLGHGPESWHGNPEFYYKAGAGPLFDMGPYYLTSLITLLGPAKRIAAMNRISFPERLITSQPFNGKIITVDVPTHLSGEVEFDSGVIATVTMSFDIWAHHLPCMEIYGTEGSLSCPDPNCFDGEVKLWTTKTSKWESIPLTHDGTIGRGVGLADMAYAIRTGRVHRSNGDLALHVVDIMEAYHTSAATERFVTLKTKCAQPAALPIGLAKGTLDA